MSVINVTPDDLNLPAGLLEVDSVRAELTGTIDRTKNLILSYLGQDEDSFDESDDAAKILDLKGAVKYESEARFYAKSTPADAPVSGLFYSRDAAFLISKYFDPFLNTGGTGNDSDSEFWK